MDEKLKEVLEKQHYRIVGNHSAVQTCRWTKKSLCDEGVCYKQKFYGIESHRCCQISPWISCQNMCLHCWRPIELNFEKFLDKKKIDNPCEIIQDCIKQQRKLLLGFKGNKKINMKKYEEAQEPMNFAISLVGEATLYPKLGELIAELRKLGKTSFLVTNGLNPQVLKKLNNKKQMPTQLYLSLNSPNKEHYDKWHNSNEKNAWKKFNETLELFPKLKTRKVIRMTLVKGKNMNDEMIGDYAKLIKKAMPDFIEVKGFMAVGFSRKRLKYEDMPTHEEIKEFVKKIAEELKKEGYKILDEQ